MNVANPTPSGNGRGRVPLGVSRLDDLLDGGVPKQSATLVFGPPFSGKALLGQLFVLRGLQTGEPAILVTTDTTTHNLRKHLTELDPHFPEYEEEGLVHFVDTYSRSIGAAEEVKHAEYVDGPVNLNGLTMAVNTAQRRFIGEHGSHRILFDSASTLVAYTNAQTTFRFLQILLGKAEMAGATTLLTLEQGMHEPSEVQMFKHLCAGVIEMKREQGQPRLSIEGLGMTTDAGWVDYEFDERSMELTGSVSAGRIR